MSEELKHECAVAMAVLRKATTGGVGDFGGTKLSLLLEKQHNSGQDGAGAAIMKDHPARLSPEAYGLRHLAFRVPSVDAAVAELAALGIPCEPVRRDTFTGEKMTFFHDPDGLPIEMHE